MRLAFGLVLALASAAAPSPAAAGDVESAAPEKAEVTIYRDGEVDTQTLLEGYGPDGLVMVRETRTIDLPAGASRVMFLNVADRIVPQSAAIDGLPSGATERNFDYDLMSPGAILEKSVGAAVKLIRTNPRTGAETAVDATIRAAPDGVILDIAGKLEALHCSGLPERLVFAEIPKTLSAKPTLSALIETPTAGRYQIRLSYLATGLLWSADYVARLAPDGRRLDLAAWVTLANRSDTTFAGAPTEVVAGQLARVPTDLEENQPRNASRSCWPIKSARGRLPPPTPRPAPPGMMANSAAAVIALDAYGEIVVTGSQIAARDLGDVKLYPMSEATTIAANQIKQVQFIDAAIQGERLYRYILPARSVQDEEGEVVRASRVLRLTNDRAHGLGVPLPQGRLAAYEQSQGGEFLFTGAGAVADVPIGSPLDVDLGPSNDVTAHARLEKEDEVSDSETRATIVVEIVNGKSTAIDFELATVTEPGVRIVRESKRHRLREGLIVWPMQLAAGARQSFRYTIAIRD